MQKPFNEGQKADLMRIIDSEKPYLRDNVRRRRIEIALKLELSTHDLDRLSKECYGKPFTDLMYERRVKRAKQILADPRYQEMKISEIAFDCGFGNLCDFNLYFKDLEEISPTEYRAFHMNFRKVMGMSPTEYQTQ
ncbi:MAG: helix-turn-helix domain-containing protein [Balneolaceae bacterium]